MADGLWLASGSHISETSHLGPDAGLKLVCLFLEANDCHWDLVLNISRYYKFPQKK